MLDRETARSNVIGAAGFYFCIFGAIGAFLPFLPLVLDERGFSPAQTSFVFVLMPLCDLLVPPAWGLAADAWHSRRRLLSIAAALTAALAATLLIPQGFWAFTGVFACFCFFRAPLIPMADASTRSLLGADGHLYGRIRVWGSIGFVVTSVLVGNFNASAALVIGGVATMYALSVGFAARLPDTAPARLTVIWPQLRDILARPAFRIFVVGTVLYGAGHAMFDLFIGLHWKHLGFSASFVGWAWAIGVTVEVFVLWLAPLFVRRIRPARLLVLCAGVAAIRWVLVATLDSGLSILVAQVLHALTFGLWYISLVDFVQGRASPEVRTSVQTAFAATLGLSRVLGFALGGQLFEAGAGPMVFATSAALATGALLAYSLLWREPR